MGILSRVLGKKKNEGRNNDNTTFTVSSKTDIPSAPTLHLRGKPDENGLYPSELVMLAIAPRYKTKEIDFPPYLSSTYEIANPRKLLTSLHTRGFLEIGKYSDALSDLKLPELKAIAASTGIVAKGKKADIVSQLAGIGEELLAPYVPDRFWVLTEKGAAALEANQYIQYFLDRHNYDIREIGIDIWTVNEDFTKNPRRPFRDVIFRMMNDQLNRASLALQKNPGSGTFNSHIYCQCTRMMALFIEEEGKTYINAADYYFQYIFRRINIHAGLQLMTNYRYSDKSRSTIAECVNSFYEEIKLYPFHRTELSRLIDEAGMSENEVRQTMILSFQRANDTGVMSVHEAADFVILELSGEIDKAKAIADKAAKQILKRIK